MAPTSALVKRDEIIWRIVDGEALLLDTDSGYYFSLNESGATIWSLLQENMSLEAIAQHMASEFEVELSEASSDVQELIAELKEAGILEQRDV